MATMTDAERELLARYYEQNDCPQTAENIRRNWFALTHWQLEKLDELRKEMA